MITCDNDGYHTLDQCICFREQVQLTTGTLWVMSYVCLVKVNEGFWMFIIVPAMRVFLFYGVRLLPDAFQGEDI